MIVGEDLYVRNYFIEYSSDEETFVVQEDCGFFICPEDTDESLEKYEEDFDYDALDFAELDRAQFFEGTMSKEQELLTEKEYEQRIQEVSERLHGDGLSENTLEMLKNCIMLGPTSCLSHVDTGILLMDVCENIVRLHVPKTLEFFMSRFAKLSDFYRKKTLSIIALDISSLKSSLWIIKRFLSWLIQSLLKEEEFEDLNNIIPFIHKIFCDLKNDPISIQNIKTPKLFDGLLTLIDNGEVDVQHKHSIIRILSIMACTSNVISHALMRKSAVQTLAHFNKESPETTRLDIATLIWAILPQSKEQELFNKYEVISESIPSPTWEREIQKDIWVPFSSSINFLFEKNYGRMTEYSFIESGTINTVNFKKLEVKNEVTSGQTAIRRKYIGHYNVLNLIKSKPESRLKVNTKSFVSNCFIRFAFSFFCKRMNYVYSNSPEEYRCWQGLCTLFESITHRQYQELLEKEIRYVVENLLVARLKNVLTGKNCDLKIVAIRLAKQLVTWNWLNEINELNYIVAIIEAIAGKEKDVKDSAQAGLQIVSDTIMKENFLLDLAKDFIKMPSVRKVMNNKPKVNHPLGITLEVLMNTPTDITQNSYRRTLTLKKFLDFLTNQDGQTDRTHRLKEFLCVFANIPLHPQLGNFNISNKLFLVLLKKLKFIIWDSVGVHPIEWNENKTKLLLKAGIRTIGAIAEKIIKIFLYTDTLPWSNIICKLLVYPFTTIQYVESIVLRQLSLRRIRRIGIDFKSKIEFFLNGYRVPSDITIYEALRRFGKINGEKFFHEVHRMNFKEKPRYEDVEYDFNPFAHPLDRHLRQRIHSKDIPEDLQNAIQLIDILYGLNKYWTSLHPSQEHQYIVDPQEFESNLLSNMANISFHDPFSILVSQSPAWINCLLENCPFMLSPGTRKMAFRVLRLDRRRSFQAVMGQFHSFENGISQTKITIRRNFLLKDVNSALRFSPSYRSWNIAFDNEFGTGVGPKRELFTLASRNLQKAELEMWSASDITDSGYIRVEAGLYPSIIMRVDPTRSDDFTKTSLEEKFETLGLLLGKAIMEEQILDLPLALPVFKWILKLEKDLTIDDLKYINPSVHKVLKGIKKIVEECEDMMFRDSDLPPESKKMRKSLVDINYQTIASYGLRFVVPGYDDIELIPGGADIDVTLENARIYLSSLQQFFFNFGVQKQMNALRRGLNRIINLNYLQIFHPEELQMMICGAENDDYWSVENLYEQIVLEGFDSCKPAVIDDLFDILSSLSKQKRRLFLEFVTGSANLPVGGFKSLSPPLRIKSSEGSYPHAQTCFNTLYLPVNMSNSKLRQFIELAITEGLGYFGLA